jgi:hypothetical protein
MVSWAIVSWLSYLSLPGMSCRVNPVVSALLCESCRRNLVMAVFSLLSWPNCLVMVGVLCQPCLFTDFLYWSAYYTSVSDNYSCTSTRKIIIYVLSSEGMDPRIWIGMHNEMWRVLRYSMIQLFKPTGLSALFFLMKMRVLLVNDKSIEETELNCEIITETFITCFYHSPKVNRFRIE